MLSLTKKSDAQPAAAPLWHPNFRNFERLPDTKVVRTTFFVNTAAIALTAFLLIWFGRRAYHIHDLNMQRDEAQKQIEDNSKQNKAAIANTKTFADEQKKLMEAEEFVRAPISPSAYIELLGKTLPKEISIEYADVHYANPPVSPKGVFNLRGLVAGTPDQATGTASRYVDMLRADPTAKAVFESITLDKLNRDSNVNLMSFEITLTLKAETKKK